MSWSVKGSALVPTHASSDGCALLTSESKNLDTASKGRSLARSEIGMRDVARQLAESGAHAGLEGLHVA